MEYDDRPEPPEAPLLDRLLDAAARMQGTEQGGLMSESANALQVLLVVMADIACSDDMTLAIARKKALRLYEDHNS